MIGMIGRTACPHAARAYHGSGLCGTSGSLVPEVYGQVVFLHVDVVSTSNTTQAVVGFKGIPLYLRLGRTAEYSPVPCRTEERGQVDVGHGRAPRLPPSTHRHGNKTWGLATCRLISSKPRRIKLGRVPCSPSRRKPGPAVTCRARSNQQRTFLGRGVPGCAE